MARGSEEIRIDVTADDQASEVLEDVAQAVEKISDEEATVEVEADTREALSRIEAFAREVEDLTDDARELRIEFRAQTIRREITSALRDLERLEDPILIEARTEDLERAQKDLRDLAELADQKYEIEIDADPKRTAQRAAGDLEDLRGRGEGLQSAIPAIRGFGDELGGTAQTAGIASQAVADLGDFALIAGERFAGAGTKTAEWATKIGTGLGAIGLAGAFAGIAVQLTTKVLPAVYDWITGAEDATKKTEELRDATEDAARALAAGRYRDAVAAIVEGNQELFDSAAEAGVAQEDLLQIILGVGSSSELSALTEKYGGALDPFIEDAQIAQRELRTQQVDFAQTEAVVDALTIATFGYVDAEAEAAAATRLTAEEANALRREVQLAGEAGTVAGRQIADGMDDAEGGIEDAEGALDKLRGKLDVKAQARDLRDKMTEAFLAVVSGAEDAEEKTDAAKIAVIEYAQSFENVPRNLETKIATLIDQGSLQQALNILNGLERTRVVRYNLSVGTVDTRLPAEARSGGGVTASPLVVGTTNVTVNMPRAADGRDVTRALDRWVRVNGRS